MARPLNCRKIASLPNCRIYKPAGVPVRELIEIVLTLDELEAIRLADLEGEYQEEAAERMKISRPTFSRIVESARKKVASALINGWALRIDGGVINTGSGRVFQCDDCQHIWEIPLGSSPPKECPFCHKKNFHRLEPRRYFGGGGRRRCRGQHGILEEDNTMNGKGRGGMGQGGGGGRGQGRGQGRGGRQRGRMGGPKAAGPGGNCVCPNCGQVQPHQLGEPCIQQKCPKCGTAMTRE